MFEDALEVRDRLAGLVDRLDPDAVSGSAAGELWAVLDACERLCVAGKMLLARRVAQTHRPQTAGAKTAAEHLARGGGDVDRGGQRCVGGLGPAAGAAGGGAGVAPR